MVCIDCLIESRLLYGIGSSAVIMYLINESRTLAAYT